MNGLNDSDCEKESPPTNMNNDVEKQAQDGNAEVIRPAEQPDSSLVEFDGPDDPGNPKNWSVRRRIAISMSMALMTFVVTFSSSIFAVATGPIAEEFGIDITTATLGVALFLLVSLTKSVGSVQC